MLPRGRKDGRTEGQTYGRTECRKLCPSAFLRKGGGQKVYMYILVHSVFAYLYITRSFYPGVYFSIRLKVYMYLHLPVIVNVAPPNAPPVPISLGDTPHTVNIIENRK